MPSRCSGAASSVTRPEIGLANNLARLLVTIEPASRRQPERALALAARANEIAGGNDPRVLDTLALALAATGRRAEAAEALTVAIALAREAGDANLVAALSARLALLRR